MNAWLIALAGALLWVGWIRYEYVRWSDTARSLLDREAERLRQMDFEQLAAHAGQPHATRLEVVGGYPFLIGWVVNWSEALAAAEPTAAARARPDAGPHEDPALAVQGFVDFLYPLVFTKKLHAGLAFRFRRTVASDWTI